VSKATGTRIWSYITGGPIQGHTLVASGTVYVPSGDHKLYALDAGTGKPRWTYTMGLHAQARPAVANGTVYIGSWDGKFYALDAKTGEPKWITTVSKSLFYAPAVSSPCVVNGKVFTTQSVSPSDSEGPHVLCLDATTGEKVWGYRLATSAPSYSSPTSDGKRLYIASLSGDLYALNLSDGSVAWKSKMGEIAYDCSPVYHDGQVICNTLLGSVESHDAATGETRWPDKTGAGLSFAWPTVTATTVYQPSMDGTLTAIPLPKQ
jgi:outer membrane protein assembly factor BamB